MATRKSTTNSSASKRTTAKKPSSKEAPFETPGAQAATTCKFENATVEVHMDRHQGSAYLATAAGTIGTTSSARVLIGKP